jgi:Predicted permease
MKFRWDKKYLYWGVTAFCVIACSLVFFWTVSQWSLVRGVIRRLNDILSPIIVGLIIAYILSPVQNFFERKIFLKLGHKMYPKREKSAKTYARIMSITTVVLILLALIASLMIFVLPQIYFSIQKLVLSIQENYNDAAAWLSEVFNRNSGAETWVTGLLTSAKDYFMNWVNTGLLPQMQKILINVSSGVMIFILSVFDFFIGIVISIYVMYRKEEFISGAKKLTYSIFSEKATANIISAMEHIHKTFGQYLVGKIINSVLMGLICATFMISFKMPYAALISVIIGVTDMIPFLGPYIGSIPSILLVLLEDPIKCAIFTAFVLVLHAFNGNIMEPRIIGTSTGMSGFWVLFAILLFGGLFGIPGMLCGVPVFALIFTSIGGWSKRRLIQKKLPVENSAYEVHGALSPKPSEAEESADPEK